MKNQIHGEFLNKTVPLSQGLTCSQPRLISEQAVYRPVTIVTRHPLENDDRNRNLFPKLPANKIARWLNQIEIYLNAW